ncbi:Ldh family oxidoreductase [Paenibacillus allorhizosphaerae]|uniref:(2R)-3-sulfolactate dehydrogenase (NADP(+)) n=1 Tax=Paenibacillus allorhizosphaerae TaxID=2849866 RepID=A0ABM8VAK5_9BACL|nr:Ldh family oxidoreductase [Paenibacillus allorhizosphaerae]CAG7616102.1 (2R)-3-sulfolactate dehydrogenase (NADP(+)) [Paenibacillus allorhizosphaerae]
MGEQPDKRYRSDALEQFCRNVFIRSGFSAKDAAVAADSLVRADLEENGSHGISRLPIYVRRIQEGRIAAKPDIRMQHHGNIVHVDGGNGLGQVVCVRALEEAVPLARDAGISMVLIRGSNHFGTAAYYCQLACEQKLALVAVTNSPPGIAPWGGKKAYLGTNPIAFGFPIRSGPPLIVDMSSSVVARGNIILANKQNKPIPEGWAIDEEGRPTTDAAAALRGAVLPLGGPKGYALAMAVEMMSAVLTGAAFGPRVGNLYQEHDPPADVGHAFILMNIGKWMELEPYYDRMDLFTSEIKSAPLSAQANEILIPGERRHRTRLLNQSRGIALSAEVASELQALGAACGTAFPDAI